MSLNPPELTREVGITKRTLFELYKKLNAFRGASSVGGGMARGIHFLTTQNGNNQNNSANASPHTIRSIMIQTAWIELIYGLLGLLSLLGVFIFAYCGGRIKQEGWKSVVNDHLSGKKLQHFFAFVLSLIGGSFAVSQLNNADDNSDILYVASALITLSYYLSIDDASKLPGVLGRFFQDSEQTSNNRRFFVSPSISREPIDEDVPPAVEVISQ